jgi:starch synthase
VVGREGGNLMKVMFVSAEVTPFAKVGGLADVAGSLPKAVHNLGVDIRVLMPKYPSVLQAGQGLSRAVEACAVVMPGWVGGCALDASVLPGSEVPIYFVEHNHYFWREHVYGPPGGAYSDNLERLSFLCRAAIAVAEQLSWWPDVFHLNDWHTSLIAALIRQRGDRAATVFTAHNLGRAYQGIFPIETAWVAGVDESSPIAAKYLGPDGINLARCGLACADKITVVSPTYARELLDPAIGANVADLIAEREADVQGIINGIDYDFWNPGTDQALAVADGYATFAATDLTGKKQCKAALQREMGLPQEPRTPLIAMVSRLDEQKGLDLVREVLPKVTDAQWVILGSGSPEYEEFFKQQSAERSNVAVRTGFDEKLAHRIYAGADIFLMPSRYEPCGLGQMIALRYGSIPVVRATGGLADTVFEEHARPNGFVFREYAADALLAALSRALDAYRNPTRWSDLIANAMSYDFSWDASAKQYVELYEEAVQGKRVARG